MKQKPLKTFIKSILEENFKIKNSGKINSHKIKRVMPDLIIVELKNKEKRIKKLKEIQENLEIPTICLLNQGDYKILKELNFTPYHYLFKPIGDEKIKNSINFVFKVKQRENKKLKKKKNKIENLKTLQSSLSKKFFDKIKGSIHILNELKNNTYSNKQEKDMNKVISKLKEANKIGKEDLRKIQQKEKN